jgi:hypothetical protein
MTQRTTASYYRAGLPGTSRKEVALRCELGEFFESAQDRSHRVLPVHGKRHEVDVVLAAIRVIVEYDGARFHAGPERERRDRRKTQTLEEAGWTVIRVRETPLRLVGADDVTVRPWASVHQIAIAVLDRIAGLGHSVNGLEAYRATRAYPCAR